MTDKTKKRVLDLLGVAVSILLPAAAAIGEFPNVRAATAGESSFLSFLNLSAAAFSVIAIVSVLTMIRFFHNRIKMPKSGLGAALILYAIVYGVETFIHSFRVILFWYCVGCAIALVLYTVADKKYGEPNT